MFLLLSLLFGSSKDDKSKNDYKKIEKEVLDFLDDEDDWNLIERG